MNSPCYITFNLIGLVLGQWLVTRGHWAGFLIWCSCNIYGVIVCFTTGIPETSCLFAAYFLVNACSLFSWLGKTRAMAVQPSPSVVKPEPGVIATKRRAPATPGVLHSGWLARETKAQLQPPAGLQAVDTQFPS